MRTGEPDFVSGDGAAPVYVDTGDPATDNARYEAIKEDPAPNILTLDERVEDADNNWTISRNENWRMFWEDWSRVMYTDRASRLTPEPMTR